MSIQTGRANESGRVTIDLNRCTVCGECAEICPSETLSLVDDHIEANYDVIFGCVACGQCMAVCPEQCIEVSGRDLSADDMLPLPPAIQLPSYEQMQALLVSRRSARQFATREIKRSVIDKLLASIATAPMGIPPSDVELLVLNSRAKVKEFGDDLVEGIRKSKLVLSLFASPPARLFLGRQTYLSMKTFIVPLCSFLVESRRNGDDYLLYSAPLALYFHSSSFSDPADAIIAATYATIAGESLGLGSCMIGTIAPFLARSKPMLRKWGIPEKNRQGIMVVFGYSTTRYRRAIKRRLARVVMVDDTGISSLSTS